MLRCCANWRAKVAVLEQRSPSGGGGGGGGGGLADNSADAGGDADAWSDRQRQLLPHQPGHERAAAVLQQQWRQLRGPGATPPLSHATTTTATPATAAAATAVAAAPSDGGDGSGPFNLNTFLRWSHVDTERDGVGTMRFDGDASGSAWRVGDFSGHCSGLSPLRRALCIAVLLGAVVR